MRRGTSTLYDFTHTFLILSSRFLHLPVRLRRHPAAELESISLNSLVKPGDPSSASVHTFPHFSTLLMSPHTPGAQLLQVLGRQAPKSVQPDTSGVALLQLQCW